MSMREAALAKLARARQYTAAQADAPSAAAPVAGAQATPSLHSHPSGTTSESPQSAKRPSVRSAEWSKSAAGTSAQVRCPLGAQYRCAGSNASAHDLM